MNFMDRFLDYLESTTPEERLVTRNSVVHLCPPDGSRITPCCGISPFDLPRTDRMTLDPSLVTCQETP